MVQAQAPRKLYNPFPGTEYLERGGYGHIFRLPNTVIVLKIPHRIINGTPHEDARAAESLEILRRERTVYEALATKAPHPNIVQYFLSTDLAIFIKFEPDTLEKRLYRRFVVPISEERQFRWIMEIARAASWLESLDYFHGDMRPANILLDVGEHVKICDFGRAIGRGCKIEVATYPFYRPDKSAVAGPAHEQFAIGSCIYNIRTGEVPYGQWKTPLEFKKMHEALVRGEYPPTGDDCTLGPVVSSCWNARHGSMKEVENAIKLAIGMLDREGSVSAHISPLEYDLCIQKCREFLIQHEQGAISMEQAQLKI
ncbi:hypothetical protein QQX98_010497 [Neonectria punicea]|uniref:EKC/KEOPS complex subunit BUD32 n=1 Tax=Neonectria punicea TaxID=979145 RepID=A0ABR1GPM4_9HYPO